MQRQITATVRVPPDTVPTIATARSRIGSLPTEHSRHCHCDKTFGTKSSLRSSPGAYEVRIQELGHEEPARQLPPHKWRETVGKHSRPINDDAGRLTPPCAKSPPGRRRVGSPTCSDPDVRIRPCLQPSHAARPSSTKQQSSPTIACQNLQRLSLSVLTSAPLLTGKDHGSSFLQIKANQGKEARQGKRGTMGLDDKSNR
ncbi:hypothetical protein BDP55DRAFT_71517 [Colletotrichum godetiae]|uniref:Uncharacterized protein n=1 Tax=Colletotrichum godetiae TaxID=1209918 RepID=A0AAJ0APA7_9PEZI|nr:uncharacterized protein BDP55DRAFT_71517 [Colletotrichum godetiae]KAK1687892.1 hypothetical protein BDP55DRAFT_71517 [Colletotrichum godetiae]